MDSLDALRRWNEKRTKVFEKINKQTPRNFVLPDRKLKKMRVRPGEISREDFASWMGALAPEAGAVNEFRTKMYQSELRGLNNRIALTSKQAPPGWTLWGYGPIKPQALDDASFRHYMRMDEKEKMTLPPAHPGIQLFFQTPCNDAPLRGAGMSGGALTQMSRNRRAYEETERDVISNSRAQARQLTAMRRGVAAPPPSPPVLTALDEAKLSIATSIETIAQQLFRGLFSTDILRDLNTVSVTIARNAPLMDTPALAELHRYIADLTAVLRGNAKNTGKDIAEDNLAEFADDADIGADYWRAMLGQQGEPSQAERRDLDKGVKKAQDVAEAIYARLEAIQDFLKKQYAVADRPIAERIAVARNSLPALGTSVDRKTYPTALREKFRMEEAQQAQKQREEERELEADRQFVAADAEAFAAPAVAPEAAYTEEEIRAERVRLIEEYLQDAVTARDAGDAEGEEANIRGAIELAELNGDEETLAELRDYLVRRGFEARRPRTNRGEFVEPPPEPPTLAELAGEEVVRRAAPAADRGEEIGRLLDEARAAAVDEDFAAEEAKIREALAIALEEGDRATITMLRRVLERRGYEAAAEEEEVVEEEDVAARAAPARGGKIASDEDVKTFFALFGDATETPNPADEVPRRGTAWDNANARINTLGGRKINRSSGSITAAAFFKKLDEQGILVDSGDGTFAPISSVLA